MRRSHGAFGSAEAADRLPVTVAVKLNDRFGSNPTARSNPISKLSKYNKES
jgi:hypothetical protein